MNRFQLLITSTLFLCTLPLSGQSTLIPFGSEWKYYDKGNQPSAQSGQEWYSVGFDDNQWDSDQAQLGYGDDDEATELDEDATTIYLRKKIILSNAAAYGSSLSVDLLYDDGAIVYLNGIEVKRVNMPSGTISYNTFSISEHGDNSVINFSIPNSLIDGDNIISVSMHQRKINSSDVSFDLKLVSSSSPTEQGPPDTNVSTNIEKITRGPYLQSTTDKSVVIKWRSAEPNRSIVRYGTNPVNLDSIAISDIETKNHELVITGLAPNTKYYYSIPFGYSNIVNMGSGLHFRTYPEQGNAGALRAWVLGDCGTRDNHQRDVRNAFYDFNNAQELDMILLLGDNAYNDGTQSEYQDALFEDMYEEVLKNTPTWSCLGNHDAESATSSSQTGTYYKIFTFPKEGEAGGVASGTEAYYSFDYGNVHFIVLDSEDSDRRVDGAMYQWCQNDIQNTLADWIIAFWHHPPYSKGSNDSDDSNSSGDMREIFLPMLEDNGVDLVLCGHSHSYERSHLMMGHYGRSSTFKANEHLVGPLGNGDGREDGDGAYEKQVTGSNAGDGAVYVVAGSSGKLSDGDLDHEAMFISLDEYGSCLLEVEGQKLNLQFVNDHGEIEDYFTLWKDINVASEVVIGGGSLDCNSIVVSGDNGGVLIGGLGAAPIEIIEIRDASGNLKYSCNSNCNEPSTYVSLPPGAYHTIVKRYTETNEWICQRASAVQVSGSSTPSMCNISVSVDGDDIMISGFNATHRLIQVFDSEWKDLIYCLDDCNSYTTISGLGDDEYYVRLLELDDEWKVICEYADYVTIGNGSNLQGNEHQPHIFLNASKNNTITELNWTTNTDFKNEYFEVERSFDGINFEPFQKVNSQSDITDYYSYVSQDPAPMEGINFYRVKQVYYNGGFRYSNVSRIDFSEDRPNNVLYPNPANNLVHLDLSEFAGVAARISIANTLGEEVYQQEVTSISESPMELRLNGIPAGGYVLWVDLKDGLRRSYKLMLCKE
jgi:3',5'-cyclic AMP phosphodiesterase CpdA